MNNEKYAENIEAHWERIKEDILSSVSEKNAFEIDLLVNSIENSLSAIKSILDIKNEPDVNDILSKLMILYDFVENHDDYANYTVSLPNDEKSLQSISFIVEFLNNYGLKKFSYHNIRTYYAMNFKYADIRELKNALRILIPQIQYKLYLKNMKSYIDNTKKNDNKVEEKSKKE